MKLRDLLKLIPSTTYIKLYDKTVSELVLVHNFTYSDTLLSHKDDKVLNRTVSCLFSGIYKDVPENEYQCLLGKDCLVIYVQ